MHLKNTVLLRGDANKPCCKEKVSCQKNSASQYGCKFPRIMSEVFFLSSFESIFKANCRKKAKALYLKILLCVSLSKALKNKPGCLGYAGLHNKLTISTDSSAMHFWSVNKTSKGQSSSCQLGNTYFQGLLEFNLSPDYLFSLLPIAQFTQIPNSNSHLSK